MIKREKRWNKPVKFLEFLSFSLHLKISIPDRTPINKEYLDWLMSLNLPFCELLISVLNFITLHFTSRSHPNVSHSSSFHSIPLFYDLIWNKMRVAEMELKPFWVGFSTIAETTTRHCCALGSCGHQAAADEAAGEPSLFPLFHQEIALSSLVNFRSLTSAADLPEAQTLSPGRLLPQSEPC